MNNKVRHAIKNNFSHIEFETDEEMEEWFFETFVPLLVLQWIGGVETQEDGSGEFDRRTLTAIKEDFKNWRDAKKEELGKEYA